MSKISGAIFDCDGTLLDSMHMWMTMFSTLISSYGIEPTRELLDTVEAMTLMQACEFLHSEFCMSDDPDSLLVKIYGYVTNAYENDIVEMPGAHAFVDSLAKAGVPMIVASSSPRRLVTRALECHGMLDYFDDVLCTEDVRDGRDKDFPDVYLEALERLGTPLGETWVFEDAPFAVRSSRRAGFHVAGIHNDHDGRDPEFIRSWSDLYSENYDSISLAAIEAFDDASRKPSPEEA